MRYLKRPSLFPVFLVISSLWLAPSCTLIPSSATISQQPKPTDASSFVKQITDIPLPGDRSRFDYLSLDSKTGRLFIAHLGAGQVIVYDTQTRKVIGEIKDLPSVHGVLAIPELNRVYASAIGINQLVSIDAKTLAITGRLPTGKYPDGIAYSSEYQKVMVSNQFGNSDTVIDVAKNQAIATVDLGGEVGNTQYDAGAKQFLAAVQTRNQLVAISPKTHQVTGRSDVPGCDHPHGLLLDSDHRLAYVACEHNATLAVVNLSNMKVLGTQSVGNDPDVLALDPKLQRLYVASESGTVSIFSTKANTLTKLEDVFAPSAHTIAVNSQTHDIYLPLENIGNRPVLRVMTAKP